MLLVLYSTHLLIVCKLVHNYLLDQYCRHDYEIIATAQSNDIWGK